MKTSPLSDGRKEAVADGIESAATALHARAGALPDGRVASAAHGAAQAMERGADYLREHDVQEMRADVERLARRHPGAVLLAAAAAGFLLARLFSRD